MTTLRQYEKKLSVVTFAIAGVVSFSHLASAQSVQLQAKNAAAKGGVQAAGFELSLGDPPVTYYCAQGARNIYSLYIKNGATESQASSAAGQFFDNCACAKYGQFCN